MLVKFSGSISKKLPIFSLSILSTIFGCFSTKPSASVVEFNERMPL